ncbi:MAG: carbohydrate-binding family 9-like protein [Candidatus Latescibacter sp.]|nr:carbohydrate-binding family 9-like protein [Candidatus Latescibacter sp.]
MYKIFLAFSVCIFSCSLTFAAPPEYTAMKAGCRMIMDGILDEPAWHRAQSVGPFKFQWYKSGEQEQTEAKIVWDDERIYFAFKCDDKYISAEQYSPNSGVSRDDCCEAFIAPVGEGQEQLDYINYEINCIGTWKVGYHADSRKKVLPSWQEPWGIEIGRYIRGTVNKDDDIDEGWVLEYSIPWSHFSEFGAKFPPKNGQVIHVGLHRTGGKTNIQYSQWSPSQTEKPQFHSPKDFGKVILSTKVLK